MTVSILQSNYIPWKGYFDLMRRSDVFVVYDHVQYTRNDWRNRNVIKSVHGKMWLTIPVRVQGLNQTIEQTTVSNQLWRRKHWMSLVSTYGRTPGFRLYRDVIEGLYLDSKEENLSRINIKFINTICQILEINTRVVLSSEIEFERGQTEALVDICKQFSARGYLSGPAAKAYLNMELFSENNIHVDWMEYKGYREYPQPFGQFIHNVSILDLIFCTGNDAKSFLMPLDE
jgi:hypothetical protein